MIERKQTKQKRRMSLVIMRLHRVLLSTETKLIPTVLSEDKRQT